MKEILRSLFRFYIDWPLLFVFIAVVWLFRTALVDDLLLPVAKQLATAADNSVASTLYLGILANILTSVLVATVGLLIFRQLMRARLSGKYNAFEVNGSEETTWGTVTILFAPLALDRHGVPVKMRLQHGDIELEGRGLLINNHLLTGHYTESGKPERRRCGSFFYELDGGGSTWRGKFVFVSPDTAKIVVGDGKWVRA